MNRWFVLGIIGLLLAGTIVAAVFLLMPQAEDDYPPRNGFYVSISADGNYILARRHSPSGLVHLFSRENNVPVWSHYYNGWIDHASMSADGNYILVDDRLSAFHLFQKADNALIWTLEPSGVEGVEISSDGTRILIADTSFRHIKWADNTLLSTYTPGGGASFAANDNYIFIKRLGELLLFNQTDNAPFWSYQAENADISISPDLSYLLGRDDTSFYLINRADNVFLWSFDYPKEKAEVVVSSDSNYILLKKTNIAYFRKSGGGNNAFYLFSKNENIPLWSYESDEWVGEMYLSISSDRGYIVAAHERGLHLFSFESSTPLWSWTPPQYVYISSVAISANGNYIVVGAEGPYPSVEGSVYLFSKDSNVPLWSYHETDPYS